ncbi:MAG: S9 family peptidase [Bacteroidetes bacterium HGW-Bacteroidetes-6]|nr:MAG: S9 family peptidase [Bacteroidetes bacterium HGW-Bacteroidetes-6]
MLKKFIHSENLFKTMKRLFLFLLVSTLVLLNAIAQKALTLEGIFSDRSLYPQSVYGIQPHFSQNWFTYTNDDDALVKIDSKGVTTILISLNELNTAVEAAGGSKLSYFPDYTWISDNAIRFTSGSTLIDLNLSLKKATLISKWKSEGENVEWTASGKNVAYTIDNNLYVSLSGDEMAVTAETNKGIVCGQTVHRNEFGINDGIFWSPKESKLAFYRMDETMVTDYPLVNINTRVAEVKNIKYPMAGMASHHVTLGVFDVASKKTVFLKTGEPAEQYLTNISWSPDDKYLFIGVLNRDQNHLKWNKYDASTGEFIQTIFEEKNDRYVEPLTPLIFLPGSSDKFIWQSQRDGYNHLYLFDTNGKLIRQLTKGPWVVTEMGGFDKKGEKVWFMATKESPLENHAYTVSLKDGAITKLTTEPGTHNVAVCKDFSMLIDSYSSIDMASACQLKTAAGKTIKELLLDKNPLSGYDVPKPEMVTLKTDDGTLLYGRLLKPVGFDATEKYPVIVYMYGGPHAQMVINSWTGGAGYFQYFLATQGYVVFTIDNRGSSNRGLEFESAIFRNLGTIEVSDQMIGVNWLKSQSWVDATRIGVHGWSYGGFMTISMLLKNPDIFKAGVAGGPVIDWKYYEVMYGERYMDTPESNPEGYKNAALANFVDQLNARLLVIQGYQDGTVVPQNALSFIEAGIKAGKLIDFFMYPNHEHNVRGKDRLHLYKMIFQYFEDHLK